MTTLRRKFLALVIISAGLLSACASTAPTADANVREVLAPTGTLRVGAYPGSPTSMVRDPKTGEPAGVALNLGQALARQMGVPVQVLEFTRVAQVLDALKAGAVDFTFTNATEARARDMDFTAPLLQLELGYLVPPGSSLAKVGDIDRAGVRVGVTQGSTSQGTLTRAYKAATVRTAASINEAQQMLRRGDIDAFATNKGILFEMADALPGYRVLDGRWGAESLAIAVPKGRDAGMPYLRQFAQQAQASGLLQSIVAKAGLRGTARPE